MPHSVYSHLWGTIAMISVFLSITLYFFGLQEFFLTDVLKIRLQEICDDVSTSLTELIELKIASNSTGFTVKSLDIPTGIKEKGYYLEIKVDNNNRIYIYARTLTYPYIESTSKLLIKHSSYVSVLSPGEYNNIVVEDVLFSGVNNPIIIVFRDIDGTIKIGLGRLRG